MPSTAAREIVGRARNPAMFAVADQGRQVALVAGDGVADERELAIEHAHRLGAVLVAPFGERAQRLEFVDDVTLVREIRRSCGRAATGKHLLDAKNLSLHVTSPQVSPTLRFYRSGD